MDNEKRTYVTRFFNWWNMSESTQAVIGGIMMAVCWPTKGDIPTYLYTTKRANRWEWIYECECTPEQYAKFTEIISGYFNTDKIEFDCDMSDIE